MDSKSIFASKTLWANLLAPVFLFLATRYGLQLDAEQQGAVITVAMTAMNIVLRAVTKQPVHIVAPAPPTSQAGFSSLKAAILVLGLGAGGCALTACSELQAVYDAATGHSQTLGEAIIGLDEAYRATAAVAQGAVEQKLITDQATLESIRGYNDTIAAALTAATQAEQSGANNAAVLFNTARTAVASFQGSLTALGIQMPAQAALPDAQPVTVAAPAS